MKRSSSIAFAMMATLVAGVLLLAVTVIQAATTPEQACKSGKNKVAGKYAACRENAEANLAKGGDRASTPSSSGSARASSRPRGRSWRSKAVSAGASCTGSTTIIKDRTNAYTN